jgi:uncharacterized protein YgbK (DUF1537 family)
MTGTAEEAGVRIGCVADDLTGASDLANEFVRQGLRTVQMIGVPDSPLSLDVDAVVIALKSRSCEPDRAVAQSLAAVRWLQAAGCPRIYFKYCSTFDSTPRGNIGPVLEAIADATEQSVVIACPAFPATGRTVYQGHLFVGDRLLNESGMEHHPLTPMTDADLRRVLQAQMKGSVGHLPRKDIAAGRIDEAVWGLRDAGARAVIADAVTDEDLFALGRYCAGVAFSTGASGLGMGIARALAGSGAAAAPATLPASGPARAIVAGSCSTATRRQVAEAAKVYPSFRVALGEGETPDAVIAEGKAWIDRQPSGATVMVYSTASPEEVAAQRAIWPNDVSAQLETILAELASHLMTNGVASLIAAGGETSGAVVERLGYGRLEIGPEIDPGVPWTVAYKGEDAPVLLALKSGNFGSDDFLIKAWALLPGETSPVTSALHRAG